MKEARRVRLKAERCTGCYACVVSCIDQHYDTDEDYLCFRRVIFAGQEGGNKARFASAGCMHCEDSPCVSACRTGAIFRDKETGLVIAEPEKCVGCGRCLKVCPYGAPKFDKNHKMHKCDGCNDRVKAGLWPACAAACPSRALSFSEGEEK